MFFQNWLSTIEDFADYLYVYRQFPQSTLSATTTTAAVRKAAAQDYIKGLNLGEVDMKRARHVTDFPSFVHVFTHLRLTMHTYHFRIEVDEGEDFDLECAGIPARKWVNTDDMEGETLSTGMRRCWQLLQ